MAQKGDINLKTLLTRGVEQAVPRHLAEGKLSSGKKLRVYWGIDPTGSRLHLGHSVPLRKMQQFVNAGHEVIMLIGSFTAMVGDPTGRDVMREPLTKKDVAKNFATYKEQAALVLDFQKVNIRYNHEWLEKLSFAEIMNLAKHFTIQQMLQRDMFKDRMSWKLICTFCREQFNSPLQFADVESFAQAELSGNMVRCPLCGKMTPCTKETITPPNNPVTPNEFLYPLMQGYDSVVLDVDCEIGGNDQLFNMLCGRKLQRVFQKREKFVLTMKLLEGIDGRKMSKTYDNCIYLTDSPQDMFGKVMSLRDHLIESYLECCTDLSVNTGKGEHPKDRKMKLAHEIVRLYHGQKAADAAAAEFSQVFQKGKLPSDIPTKKVEGGSHTVVDLLAMLQLVSSKSEARRLIQAGGVRVDEQKVSDVDAIIERKKSVVVQVGPRRFCKVIFT